MADVVVSVGVFVVAVLALVALMTVPPFGGPSRG